MTIEIRGLTYPVKDKLKALGCRWDGARKCWTASTQTIAAKANALVQAPVYNSPPPADLGPIDAAAEAAKHNRQAVAAESIPFRRASGNGENHVGETFWGKHEGTRNRYLVVRQGCPTYLSQDWLEDMDQFQTDPGWYCDVQAVAVTPTAEELANDPAVAKAKAEALAKRRDEIVSAVQHAPQEKDARMQRCDLSGMMKCWGAGRSAGHQYLWSDGVSRLVYETSSWDDGGACWMLTDAGLAAEAMTLAEKLT